MTTLPSAPGSYVLELSLAQPARLTVGRLGEAAFPAGWYYYCGSALRGLRPRVARHWRGGAKPHWHIDVLRLVATPVGAYCQVGSERLECVTATLISNLSDTSVPLARFGASDCRCVSHLFHAEGRLENPEDSVWIWYPIQT